MPVTESRCIDQLTLKYQSSVSRTAQTKNDLLLRVRVKGFTFSIVTKNSIKS